MKHAIKHLMHFVVNRRLPTKQPSLAERCA